MFHTYLQELFRFAGAKALLALALLVFLGLTEGIGLVMLIPFLQLAGVGGAEEAGGIVGWIGATFRTIHLPMSLPVLLCVYVGIITLHSLLKRYQSIINAGMEYGFSRILGDRIYQDLAYADWIYLVRQKTADIAHILTTQLERIGAGTHFLLLFIGTAVIACVYITLAASLSLPMTAFALLCAGVLMLVVRPFNLKSHKSGEAAVDVTRSLYGAVSEHLAGMKVAKSYGVEDSHVRGFQRLNQKIASEFVRFTRILAETRMIYEIGAVLALSLFFYIALEMFHVPVSKLLVLVFLFGRLMPMFSSLHQSYQQIINMLPAFHAAMELQRACVASAEPRSAHKDIKPIPLKDAIECIDVSFRYSHASESYALKDINLVIGAGLVTAIVGPSGSGKSTLADILMGLIVPESGRLIIDQQPLRAEMVHSWRQSIGYVPQETFLFHDTLRANLLWARQDATEEEIWEALDLSAAREFVKGMPAGLDSIMGDRGVRLSGGERQRIAMARALLRKPNLLILDEATSSLDAENEKTIHHAIRQLGGKLTVILIAHRLSTIRWADHIVILEKGQIVETGSWEEVCSHPESRLHDVLGVES